MTHSNATPTRFIKRARAYLALYHPMETNDCVYVCVRENKFITIRNRYCVCITTAIITTI